MRKLSAALTVLAVVGLAGCASTNDSERAFSMTSSEMKSVDALTPLEGYNITNNLEDVFSLGTQAPNGKKSEHIVGTIEDILPAESTKVGLLNLTKTWVPILINVEQSTPYIHRSQLVIRVFPSSENMPTLESLKKGERVLAIGVAPEIDETDTFGVSLGWLFEITSDGDIVSTNDKREAFGKFETYADQLGLKSLN